VSGAVRSLPALGWDPCAGDVAGSRALAGALRALARRLRDGEAGVRADAPAWRGPAAHGHRRQVEALTVSLVLVATSVDDLAGVVEGWAATLGRLQVRAEELERRMVAAKEQVADASSAFGLAARASAPRDVLVGRPSGWTAHVATHAEVERASTAQAAVEAAAQRLHEEYADAADGVVLAMRSAVDVGMRAPWRGVPGREAAADGGLLQPQRSVGTVLRRSVLEDWYGEGVRRHAEELDAYAEGSAVSAAALEVLPVVPAQVAGVVAGTTSSLATAHLELFVAEDPGAALGLAGTAVVGGAVLRGGGGARLTSLERSVSTATSALPTRPAPDAWDVPGHLGTARRSGAEAAAREQEERRTAVASARAEEVRRCTGG